MKSLTLVHELLHSNVVKVADVLLPVPEEAISPLISKTDSEKVRHVKTKAQQRFRIRSPELFNIAKEEDLRCSRPMKVKVAKHLPVGRLRCLAEVPHDPVAHLRLWGEEYQAARCHMYSENLALHAAKEVAEKR